MSETLIHFVRHGETANPDGIIYCRLPGFGLTEEGHRAARQAAEVFAATRKITALLTSPLQRTRETAAPFEELLGLPAVVEEALIEPWSAYEGRTGKSVLETVVWRNPWIWPYVYSQRLPSWGTPYFLVARRMMRLIDRITGPGEIVCVTHHQPIAMVRRRIAGERLWPSPIDPDCTPLSVTTVRRSPDGLSVERWYPVPGTAPSPAPAS